MADVTAKSWKKSEPSLKDLAKKDTVFARLHDYSGTKSQVSIRSNPLMRKNRVFEICIGEEKAIIDVDQHGWYSRLF